MKYLCFALLLSACTPWLTGDGDSCAKVENQLRRVAYLRQQGLISASKGDSLHKQWASRLEALAKEGCP